MTRIDAVSEALDGLNSSVAEAGSLLRSGGLSSSALVERCLGRIAALNPTLNAFITVTAELARERAREADRETRAGRWRSALQGLPVAVKDLYDTAGIRTTAAFEPFANRVPTRDADLVAKLREAGAVLVGKTNMHTLGKGTTSLESHFGPVVNPRSARHVAGGSSGGSAAAVAAGLAFATVDTDAIGSGRLPAAICGVVCHKPTFGLLSAQGILAGEKADPAIVMLSHPCVMARSAEDVASVLAALTTPSDADKVHPSRLPPRRAGARRVGIVANFSATAEVRAAFEDAVAMLGAMGIDQVAIDVPFDAASFNVRGIEQARATVNATLFADVDAIALPTLVAATPTVDEARAAGPLAVSSDNTFFANYFGLPAITVPAGVDRSGLPLGLQLVGPADHDDNIVALAAAYQRSRGWSFEPPHALGTG